MRNKIIENKAITLIALIITIIVLLILAGVALRLVNNGLVDKAASTQKETIIAKEKEEIYVGITSMQIDYIVNDEEKSKLNQRSGVKIETDNGEEEISVYANNLAYQLNSIENTLENTLKASTKKYENCICK